MLRAVAVGTAAFLGKQAMGIAERSSGGSHVWLSELAMPPVHSTFFTSGT